MEREFKLTEEDARTQVQAFLDHYDFDPADLDDSSARVNVEQALKGLIKQVRRGKLEFRPDGTATQTLEGGTTMVYAELGAQAKKSMKGDTTDFYGKIYALAGALTGLGETAILKLKGVDMSIVENLGLVFLRV